MYVLSIILDDLLGPHLGQKEDIYYAEPFFGDSKVVERLRCRVPRNSEHWISESCLVIDGRGNLPGGEHGQTESVDRGEALPDR